MTPSKPANRSFKTFKFLLKAGVSAGLLGLLLYRTDLFTIKQLFNSLHWTIWLTGVLLYLLAQILSAQRWRYLAHTLGFTGDFPHFLAMYFTGMFANLFLPSSIGGDAIRVLLLARRFGDARGIISVLLDRGIGMFAMLFLASFFSLMPSVRLSALLQPFLWLSTGSLLLAMICFPLIFNHLAKRWPGLTAYLAPILTLYTSKTAWFWCILTSTVIQLLGFSIGLLAAFNIQIPLTFSQVAVALSLVTLLSLLPISLNGLGLREGGLIYLLGLWGIPKEHALTIGLFLFGVQCICSLMGGFFYVFALKDR